MTTGMRQSEFGAQASPLRSARRGGRRVLGWVAAVVAALAGLGWVGLRVLPAPFPAPTSGPVSTMPLPTGLPTPVARFYRLHYGEQLPVVQTAVMTGRATMRIGPITFPARYRWTHTVGQAYRHYIELTFFGLPIVKVNEHFVAGRARLELPWGVQEGPQVDQAANLGMWAELLHSAPSALLTDPRVRWEPVDDETALLVVPFGAAEERFVLRFDPATGDLLFFEVMRYRQATGPKSLWINGMWLEDGRPWLVVREETVTLNGVVDTSPEAKGP